jgi:hypothetical protein
MTKEMAQEMVQGMEELSDAERKEMFKPVFEAGYEPTRVRIKEGQIVARSTGDYQGAGSVFDVTSREASQYSNLFEIVPAETPIKAIQVRPKAGQSVVMLNTVSLNVKTIRR